MCLSVQNSGHLVKDVYYFDEFSFLLGDLMAQNLCSLVITWQVIIFWGPRQVYHVALAL